MNEPRILTLIDKLRNDAGLRNSFHMAQWADPQGEVVNACNTVGCIAGKAMMLFDETLPALIVKEPDYWIGSAQSRATKLLGLEPRQAGHLFLPNSWVDYVINPRDFLTSRWSYLSHNERPSLSTVAEMVAWCESLPKSVGDAINTDSIFDLIKPDHAANALEGLLSHPGYVNWAEALA